MLYFMPQKELSEGQHLAFFNGTFPSRESVSLGITKAI